VLLRSNVNLLVNLAYIVSDQNPNERAKEFVADSWIRYTKFMKGAFDHEVNPADSPIPLPHEELEALSERWCKVNIADRAKKLPEHHYKTGYKFYSGIEHSDALALFGYIADWNEIGPRIESGPSDSHLEVVLMHSAEVMATILDYVCRYWGIDRPDVFRELSGLFSAFGTEPTLPCSSGRHAVISDRMAPGAVPAQRPRKQPMATIFGALTSPHRLPLGAVRAR